MKKEKIEIENKHARDFGREGCVVKDWYENGVRRLIMNIRGSHFTQYVGIPENHPLAGFSYENLPIDCHGGLTFSSKGKKETKFPEGFWWYGWDYSHLGDYIAPPKGLEKEFKEIEKKYPNKTPNKDWTLGEEMGDAFSAICDFKNLMDWA